MTSRVALAFVSLMFAAGVAFSKDEPPAIKKDCGICHVSHKMGATVALRAPVADLCIGCHENRVSPAEHIVGVAPSMQVQGLPLDREGKMTCITCHDPHGTAGFVKMLRDKPSAICSRCHRM